MVEALKSPRNDFVRRMRKVYNPIGFGRGYNFVLFFLAVGYLLGFALARIYYLSYNGVFCNKNNPAGTGTAPGECYYWLQNPFEIGMKIHLFCILPASILVCLQFVPVIRHNVRLFHRINGYIVIILSLISSAGILMVAQHAFGGDYATQMWCGVLVILTTIGFIMAIINIKLLQIEQHRAWMLRTWAWFATIITLRIIMIISARIISHMDNWYAVRECAVIATTGPKSQILVTYPACSAFYDGTNPDQRVIVQAKFAVAPAIQTAVALGIPFAGAGWLALVLHTIAIELYLRLTPAESDRLRQVSYERQLEAGSTRPGYAGLTAERFGDANPDVPREVKESPTS